MSIPQQTAPIYQHPTVDFNWIADGWRGFIQRPWLWAGATFLAGAILMAIYFLSMAPVILYISSHAPPNIPGHAAESSMGLIALMYAVWFIVVLGLTITSFVFLGGMFRMAHRQLQGEEIGVLDFFSVGDSLGALIAMGLLYIGLSVVGSIGCGIPAIVGYGLLMFAPLIAVTQRVSAIEACRQSFAMLRAQWFMAVVFVIVLWLLVSLGGMLLGVGALVTAPVGIMAITAGYYRLGGEMSSMTPVFESAQTGVWPPPPNSAVETISTEQQSSGGWTYPPPPGGSAHLPQNPYGYNGTVAVSQNAADQVEADAPNEQAIPTAYTSKENQDADGSPDEPV